MTRDAGGNVVGCDGLTSRAGPVLDAERHADLIMLRTALSDLAEDDRQVLFDRHVHDRAVIDIATGLGVRPHTVTIRLRRAEDRLAGSFATAQAHGVDEPECRSTRAAMHDYLKGHLLPGRQLRLEVHMDGCTECTRAFVDVRDVSWVLRDLAQHLRGTLITGTVRIPGASGTTEAKPRSFGKAETAVAAGVLVALAIGAAYLTKRPDQPPVQALEDATGSDSGTAESGGSGGAGSGRDSDSRGGDGGAGGDSRRNATTDERPASIPPADPVPRPATTPKEDVAAAPVDAPPLAADEEHLDDQPLETAPAPGTQLAPGNTPNEPQDGHASGSESDIAPEGPTERPPGPSDPEPTPSPTMPLASKSPDDDPDRGRPGNEDNNNDRAPDDSDGWSPELRHHLASWLADLGLAGGLSR